LRLRFCNILIMLMLPVTIHAQEVPGPECLDTTPEAAGWCPSGSGAGLGRRR
jgi:hypothetical protein